jgi:hypothetical protein
MIFLNNELSQANSTFFTQKNEISKLKSQLELHQELEKFYSMKDQAILSLKKQIQYLEILVPEIQIVKIQLEDINNQELFDDDQNQYS